jgi:hypothetical protein
MHKNQLTGRLADPAGCGKTRFDRWKTTLGAEARTDSAGLYAALKRRSSTVMHAFYFS